MQQKKTFSTSTLAYDLGCKGITVYRDGSRSGQVLSVQSNDGGLPLSEQYPLDFITPISRDIFGKVVGTTNKYKTACGSLYITVNHTPNSDVVETFVHTSKAGICKSNIDGLSRMVSVALRSGTSVNEIIDQLRGINCAACSRATAKGEKLDGISCPDILARAIQSEYLGLKSEGNTESEINNVGLPQCPDCKTGDMKFEGGCAICTSCGYSKCAL